MHFFFNLKFHMTLITSSLFVLFYFVNKSVTYELLLAEQMLLLDQREVTIACLFPPVDTVSY